MKKFRQLKEEANIQRYKKGEIFQEGTLVMNTITGEKGTIIRSGVNYVIVVTEDQTMFRAWVKDIRELNSVENINKERKKSIFFTNGQTETNYTNSSQ